MFSSLNPLPSFPPYAGPYKVGSSEIEIPTAQIPSSARIPDPKITTLKFRVFYPTTSTATSKKPVSWLPEPHKESLLGLISFTGASPRLQKLLSLFPNLLSYVTIPAVRDAPLLDLSGKYPVAIFSHGLGGNANAYSSICGNLASCGLVVFAPEHRDGSCPVAYAKTRRSNSVSSAYKVPYQKHPHRPDPEVLAARNAQLRIRCWELDLLYSAITALNAGTAFDTYSASCPPSFMDKLDLSPGKVTWLGHSFGGATIVQFIKSIYYYHELPVPPENAEDDQTPLYSLAADHALVEQVTPLSPLILLDLWTMPLRGPLTEWLWAKPLPCYAETSTPPTCNVLAIMSTEFTGYTELITRMKALLSASPVAALEQLTSSSSTTTSTSTSPSQSPTRSPTSSTSTLTPLKSTSPLLFTTPHSAHLSQSDFGPLFPYLNRRFLRVDDPLAKIQLNVRAILQTLRIAGIEDLGSVNVVRTSSSDVIVEKLDERHGWDAGILLGDDAGEKATGLVRMSLTTPVISS